MKHPSEAALALYAGGELGWFARWRNERHLATCGRCRKEVEAYLDLRSEMTELSELPGIAWNRLASEMKANIRLGIEAGECVREVEPLPKTRGPVWASSRALVAYASALALVLTGLVLERPVPVAERVDGVVVQANASGIELREGAQAISLLHSGARDITYSAGAQGAIRARYVDSETGYVTINNVYAQ